MRTKLQNPLVLLTLSFLLLACSKTETNDMMFKKVSASGAQWVGSDPMPGESNDPGPMVTPAQDPAANPASSSSSSTTTSSSNNNNTTSASDTTVVQNPPTSTATTTTTTSNTNTNTTNTSTNNNTASTSTDTSVVTYPPTTTTTTTNTNTNTTTNTTTNTSSNSSTTTVVVDDYRPYPESEIPACKVSISVHGLGCATRVAIASASKDDLKSKPMQGFGSLSSAELKAMRDSLDSKDSSSLVQVLKGENSFDPKFYKKGQLVLVVVDENYAKPIDLGGLGKDAQIHIMVASRGHNTVCVDLKGNSNLEEVALTVLGDPKYVARGNINTNSNGSKEAYLKVIGSHQTGSKYEGNAVKDTKLTLITEGKNDTFSQLVASGGIDNCQMHVKVKGMNDTGWGLKGNFLTHSKMSMEIEGKENVQTMMDIKGKMQGNDFDGWLKALSGGKLDPLIADLIDLMPVS